jgi:hypothetical protein
VLRPVAASTNSRELVPASAVAANFGQCGARVAISAFVPTIAAAFGRSTGGIGLVLVGTLRVLLGSAGNLATASTPTRSGGASPSASSSSCRAWE